MRSPTPIQWSADPSRVGTGASWKASPITASGHQRRRISASERRLPPRANPSRDPATIAPMTSSTGTGYVLGRCEARAEFRSRINRMTRVLEHGADGAVPDVAHGEFGG